MLAIILIAFGFFTGDMTSHQDAYCKCYRDDFKGAYCQNIKANQIQGSCHK